MSNKLSEAALEARRAYSRAYYARTAERRRQQRDEYWERKGAALMAAREAERASSGTQPDASPVSMDTQMDSSRADQSDGDPSGTE